MRGRLLITGASGLLGSNLVCAAAGTYAVTAVVHEHLMQHPAIRVISTDLTHPGAADELLRSVRPQAVIHAAAEANVDGCEADEERAFRINCDMAEAVARAAKAQDAYFVHISTDAVFDGSQDRYVETDPPAPVNAYGRSKAAGEQAVQRAYPQAAVIRTNFYGWNMLEKLSLSEWFLDRLKQGGPLNGFKDVFFSPLLVNDLALALLRLVERPLQGLYHLGGSECVSKYSFGRLLAQAAGFDPGVIRPVRANESGLAAKRPLKLCLDSDRMYQALGLTGRSIAASIQHFLELGADGYADSLKAMRVGV